MHCSPTLKSIAKKVCRFPLFEIMDIHKTHCNICPATFNTTTALLRHRCARHAQATPVTSLQFYRGEKIVDLPSTQWKGRRPLNYKQWLGGVVDSINSCLHPKVPGNELCRSSAFSCRDHEMNVLVLVKVNETGLLLAIVSRGGTWGVRPTHFG